MEKIKILKPEELQHFFGGYLPGPGDLDPPPAKPPVI